MHNTSFKEAIYLLEKTDRRPYYTFERIVLTLLEKMSTDDNKPINTYLRLPEGEIDALLPQGFGEEHRPTIVEVKYNRGSGLNMLKESLARIVRKFEVPLEGNNLLIIVSRDFKNNEKKALLDYLSELEIHINYILWDLNDLSILFDKYAEFVSGFVPQIEKRALKNIVDKSLEFKDWKKDREILIQRLAEAHKIDDLTLFLGAGVSSSAGLPDWPSLLSQLLVSMISSNLPDNIDVIDETKKIIAKSLQELNNSSPLLEARYVNSGLRENFEREVTSILYKDVKERYTSLLIDSIGNLCIPPRASLGIRAIVTYNFDDLIERKLEILNLKYKSIYRDIDIPLREELGVFHVHGFLPENNLDYEGVSESLLVFSEKNYHTLMQEPYFWSNLIQLNFFKENTCLLIGLSGTDPNLRRLLEIAKRKNKVAKHFIFLKRTDNSFFIDKFKDSASPPNDTLIEAINSIHHQLQERSFDELGLNIIWYEDYDELPNLVERINSNKK